MSKTNPISRHILQLVAQPTAVRSILLAFLTTSAFAAPIVWTGPVTTFTKAPFSDPLQAANQDRMTPNVWITRGANSQGIFNAKTELSYAGLISPADTEWATGTTANYGSLTYQTWESWAKSFIGGPPSTVGVNAVLHLISEDIYLDIKFTAWSVGPLGGGPGDGAFSYQRSTPPPENNPPVVAIMSPTNTESFTAPANVMIVASATDDGSVTNVAFFSGTTLIGQTNNLPYSIVAPFGVGAHVLTAVATDDLGLSSTSSVVNITVSSGNIPPSIVLTNPANNAVLSASANLTINADAADSDGTVTNVAFFDGAAALGSDATAPFSLTTRLALGVHTITAVATDDQGAATVSAPIEITMDRYLPAIPKGDIAVLLQPIATGLAAPDYAISPPDDDRLFVVEQRGLLLIVSNGVLLPTPALDLSGLISTSLNPGNANDERGLLGLAFHPGFNQPASPGYQTLYTFNSQPIVTSPTYAAPNGAAQGYQTTVNEWKISSTNVNMVDPASRREIISFGKNANNHNGGTITFGPDAYLYLGLGDGGNANDVGASHLEPGGNAQNLTTPFGKMLRLDPLHPALNPASSDSISSNGQYRIPTTNPFQGAGEVPEIYALGLRNPYRFAFDRLNGELILADVGQNNIEEINRIVLGGNYGWAIKEGDFLFNRTNGPAGAAGTIGAPPGNRSPGSPAGLIDPISGPMGTLEYDHNDGISVTGGFVYRGNGIPELYGKYVFGDLAIRNAPPRVDGRLFYADLDTGVIQEFLLPQFANGLLPDGLTVHGFGQDDDGELYALVTNTPANGTGGIIYKFVALRLTVQPIGSQLEISWPVIGGHLESQTNNLSAGIGSDWQPVPDTTATNRVFLPIDPANGSVYFRLAFP